MTRARAEHRSREEGKLTWPVGWPAGIILAAALVAYANSFSVPFLLDDLWSILSNASIRRLWPIGPVLFPSAADPVPCRPLLNLSFALNYAVGGTAVAGYHWGNWLIHAGAGLSLFGLVRRTLRLPRMQERFGAVADSFALGVALLWTLHPLQTISVTYLSQRAESLMGLCYLLTLYCFVRTATSPRPWVPGGLAIACCALGMASKEVMVTAPVVVVLFDRTFLAGSFKAAWQQRGRWHLGLATTWLLLGYFMVHAPIGNHVGYATGGLTAWTSLLTESRVVTLYQKLALWPHPLIFDYGPEKTAAQLAEVWPYVLWLGLLLSVTLVALRRWPVAGFLSGCFFLILAPTSSVIPVLSQPMAENRMYLPLAAILLLGVGGLHLWLGRKSAMVVSVLAAGLGALTLQRNHDYGDALGLWRDTVAKQPGNPRAHCTLAHTLVRETRRIDEAIAHYETALTLKPDYPEAHNNLANLLADLPERSTDTLAHYEAAVRLKPDYLAAHYNLAMYLERFPDRINDAISHYETILRFEKIRADDKRDLRKNGFEYLWSHYHLGTILLQTPGRLPEAIAHLEAVLRQKPNHLDARRMLEQAQSRENERR